MQTHNNQRVTQLKKILLKLTMIAPSGDNKTYWSICSEFVTLSTMTMFVK